MRHLKYLVSSKQIARLWQSGFVILGGAAIAAGFTLATPSSASAQAAYGSYLGVGISGGVTSSSNDNNNGDDDDSDSSKVAAVIAFRYKFLRVPVSARTQVIVGDGAAIVPTVSYDLPVNWRTDVYLGVGASIPLSGDKTTPVGNKTAFALQPGVDYVLPNSNFVVFGNAVIAFSGYRNGGGTAASLQGGVGVRF